MYWNHRVIEHKDGSLAIVEAFYDLDKDGEGFGGWAEASLYADRDEGLESLRGQVKWFEAALDKSDGTLTQFQGDGLTCPKCRRSVATNVCPFDGTIIVSGPRTHETWSPKGTIPFRPKVN